MSVNNQQWQHNTRPVHLARRAVIIPCWQTMCRQLPCLGHDCGFVGCCVLAWQVAYELAVSQEWGSLQCSI